MSALDRTYKLIDVDPPIIISLLFALIILAKSSVASKMPTLVMSANEQLTLQGNPVQEKELPKTLRVLKNQSLKGSLLMKIDRNVSHGRVVRLMSLVRESGFQHIIFGTQSNQPE